MKYFDRIIFCHKDHRDFNYGGVPIVDNTNKRILQHFTADLVDIPLERIEIPAKRIPKYVESIKSIFKNYKEKDYLAIENNITTGDCLIFISHSQFGTLIKRIRKNNKKIKIVVFFHNVEINMSYGRLKYYRWPYCIVEMLRDIRSELLVKHFADDVVLFNSREADLYKKIYRASRFHIVPMSLKDKYKEFSIRDYSNNTLKLLFVGTYFWGNIPGLKQLVSSVMPYVNAELYIVGKDTNKIKEEVTLGNNVFVKGAVTDEELAFYYKKCNIFVAPVLLGGGMKTKVAEAMMYGLPIIGTKEAFCGYEMDISRLGFCSDTISDYVNFIIDIDKERKKLSLMSQYSRKIFEEKYSEESAISKYEQILF